MAQKAEDWQRDETGLRQARKLLQPCISISGNGSAESSGAHTPEGLNAGVAHASSWSGRRRDERGWNDVLERRRERAPGGWGDLERVRKLAARKEPKRARRSRTYGTIGAFRSQRLAVNI
jgi:hypothetical protein